MIKFKAEFNIKKYNVDCDIRSIINCPIVYNEKCIGIIADYDMNTDEAIGYLWDLLGFNFNQNKEFLSIEIMKK